MEQFPLSRQEAKGTKFEHLFATPSHWPDEVHFITLDNMGELGRHTRTRQLYWDGSPLVTERRFATFERVLAGLALALTAIGVAATVVQAWTAIEMLARTPLLT